MHDQITLRSYLEQSEEQFRILFDGIDDAVILFEVLPDNRRGPIKDVNEAACKRLGYTREQLLSMTVNDIDTPESAHTRPPVNERFVNTDTALFETSHLTSDGRHIPVEVNARKFKYKDRTMILSIVRDISARKENEKLQEEYLKTLESEVAVRTAEIEAVNISLQEQAAELKSAQLKASKAEKNIRGLLDASNQSIMLIETDGTIIHVNKTLARTLSSTPEEMIGKDLFSYIPPHLAQSRKRHLKQAIDSRTSLRFQDSRNGREILQTIYPIFENDEVSRIAIFAEDMSESIRREEELNRSRHIKSVLFEIMNYSHTADSLKALLRSIHKIMFKELKAKNFFIALLDQEQEKLTFQYCVDETTAYFPSINRINDPSNKRLSLLPIRKNQVINIRKAELKQKIRNNEIEIFGVIPEVWIGVPLRLRGHPIGVLVIQDYDNPDRFSEEDIQLFAACTDQIALAIERKSAESAMQESEEQYRAFFEDNHSAMFIIDPESGSIIDTNRAAANFYGYSKDELKSKNIDELNDLHLDDIKAKMTEAQKNKVASFIFQHRLANDEIRDVEVFSGPFEFKGKTRLISIIHDITARLKNEKDLSQAKEAAVMASKAKDEFLANISHEIRTPLNGVMGMLQVLESSNLQEEQKSCVQIALQSSRNLLRVLDDILDVSKIEVGTLALVEESFNLKGLLDQCLNLFRQQAEEKGINFLFRIHPDAENNYIGDEGRIRQILFNLLGNALKFTENGAVHLEVEVSGHCHPAQKELFFSISDTGIGIPENKIECIFDSFTQVDGSLSRKYKGAGLGLAIVKRLVDLMGGKINIKSRLNEGTVVDFSIVLKVDKKTLPATSNSLSSNITTAPLKIMLVEDELVNRLMAKKLLEKKGHEIICAENGAECLEMLTRHEVDVILMDIQMPVMDGLQATKTIRSDEAFKQVSRTPIIALSAHATEQSKQAALQAGVNGYICKPFEWNDLEQCLYKISSEI